MSYRVRAPTAAPVIASISTPVRPSSRHSTSMRTPPSAGSIRTSTESRPMGGARGMRSGVRLAPITAARRTVARTSPLGRSPAMSRSTNPGLIDTTASARARRRVTALEPTSTMRTRPCSSRWVSGLSSVMRASGWGTAKQLDLDHLASFDDIDTDRNHGEPVGCRQGRQHVRRLATGRADDRLLTVLVEGDTEEDLLLRIGLEALPCHYPDPGPQDPGSTLHGEEGASGELLERQHHPNRLA